MIVIIVMVVMVDILVMVALVVMVVIFDMVWRPNMRNFYPQHTSTTSSRDNVCWVKMDQPTTRRGYHAIEFAKEVDGIQTSLAQYHPYQRQ